MKNFIPYCVLFLFPLAVKCAEDKPFELISCSFSQLDKCILNQSPMILHAVQNGIPSLGIPSFNPYHMRSMQIPYEDMDVELTNIDIYGIPEAEIQDLRIKFRKRRGFFKVYFKQIKVSAQFRINGVDFMMTFDNVTGPVTAILEDIEIELDAKFRLNKQKLELTDSNLDIHFDHLELEGTANDDDEKGKIRFLKDFINKNWRMMYKEYKESVTQLLEDVILPVLTQVGNALLAKILTVTRQKSRDF